MALLKGSGCEIADTDIISSIWENRPALSGQKIWILDECYAGASATDKLKEVRSMMGGADAHILSDLTAIAWLLNLRGSDVSHTPIFYAHMIIRQSEALLYAFKEAFDENVLAYLKELGVTLRDYEAFYEEAAGLIGSDSVLVDARSISHALYSKLIGAKILFGDNPESLLKARKNATEISNIRKANILDGVAMVKLLCWIDKKINEACGDGADAAHPLTELEITAKADELRNEAGALDVSFDTIVGYGPNSAVVHYQADEKSNAVIEPQAGAEPQAGTELQATFLLIDSGGHYLNGTTDITRTMAIGEPTAQMKRHYTAVLKSHIALARAVFPTGTSGARLDMLAREPLYEQHLNFGHGTGHGIGYLLSVHEGPQNISPVSQVAFEEGMLTSDEPGVYFEGEYGIRIENDLLCVSCGDGFLCFDNLTLCPYDYRCIDESLLTDAEKEFLYGYDEAIMENLREHLGAEELDFLEKNRFKSSK